MKFHTLIQSFNGFFNELPSHEKELVYPQFEVKTLGTNLRQKSNQIFCAKSC